MARRDRGPTEPPLLQTKGLSRTYGEAVALHPVDLALNAGRCLALMGANGSGKSTLLRLVTVREEPSAGEVRLAGREVVRDDRVVRAAVAVAMGDGAAYPDLTVREHLLLVAIAHGQGGEAEEIVDALLEEFALTEQAGVVPPVLSSGQRQALSLCAALARPRRLLVLDEPEQRLDPAARERLGARLAAEKAAGVGVLMATHAPDLAEEVADEVLRLDLGRVTARGRTAAVLAQQ